MTTADLRALWPIDTPVTVRMTRTLTDGSPWPLHFHGTVQGWVPGDEPYLIVRVDERHGFHVFALADVQRVGSTSPIPAPSGKDGSDEE